MAREGVSEMKAAVLTGIGKVEVRDVPRPEIVRPDDVLVRVGAVGVCGSDVHYFREGRIGDQVVSFPAIIGHEGAGVVESVGPAAASRLEPGARVAIEPAVVCGRCDQCLRGRPNTCRRLLFLGTPGQLPGCLSEYIVMPARNCFPLPAGISVEDGALAEPLSIALYSLKVPGERAPEKAAVLGAGPIGLSVLLAARALAPVTVYITDKIDERLEAARSAGAAWAGNPDREDIVAEISAREPLLLDTVFECSGDQAALDQAVSLLEPGGRLVIVGIPAPDRVSFDPHKLRRREITVLNVRRQRNCFSEAIRLIADGRVDPRFMVTHRFGLADAARAFELAADYRDGVLKSIIHLP
jgi:L-iditol 2-dehydrogenase